MSDVLAERRGSHGAWPVTASIAVRLKAVVNAEWQARIARGDAAPTSAQIEGLDLVCTKIARILSGDPAHADHWRDIDGYLRLLSAPAPGSVRGTPARFASDDELRAQRESWVRGEMAFGSDRQEGGARMAMVARARPTSPPLAGADKYTGDLCPDCGGMRMVRPRNRATCLDCGARGGCG